MSDDRPEPTIFSYERYNPGKLRSIIGRCQKHLDVAKIVYQNDPATFERDWNEINQLLADIEVVVSSTRRPK